MNRLIIGSLCGAMAGAALTYILLAPGAVRDDAISGPVNQWHDYGIEQECLPEYDRQRLETWIKQLNRGM